MQRGIIHGFLGMVAGFGIAMAWLSIKPQLPSVDADSDASAGNAETGWVAHARDLTMPGNREYALPLNNPDTVPAEQANHVDDSDMVIGITLFGKARAYPWWIMSNFHVVNDTLMVGQQSKIPIMVAMCEQCSGSAAFIPTIPELSDRPLTFQICGVHNGTFEIADFQSQSRWHPFAGEATVGPLKGRRLTQIGSTITSWKSWVAKHPHTDVVLGSEGMRQRPHGQSYGASMGHAHMHPVFGNTSNLEDKRLASNALVFGLLPEPGQKPLAIPFELIESNFPLQIDHQGKSVLLIPSGEYGVSAFACEQDGEVLTFQVPPDASSSLLQDQLGNQWDEYGRRTAREEAVVNDGENQLRMLRGYLTEWYEWISAQPGSMIYQPAIK